MVKASKHRDANYDCRISGCAERWPGGQALPDPLVRTRAVEIVEAVFLQHVLEVPLCEDDDVIEALSADAAEKSLANRIHERSLNGRPKNADTGTGGGAAEVSAELAVVVANDELGSGAEGRGLPHLLRRPLRGRVPRDADVHDALGVDVNDEEREDWPKPNVVHLQKVARSHGVVVQERVPALPARRQRPTACSHVPLDRAFRDVNPKLEELAANTLGTAESILRGHASNELDDIRRHARSRRLRRLGLPTPQQTKAFAVPAKDGFGLHEQQRVAPSWKRRYKERDQSALMWLEDPSLHLPCRHNELLAQKDVLGQQLGPGAQHVSREATDDRARSWTQRFADSLRNAREDRLQFGEDTSGHETDLRRDELHFKPLL
jgi:hypothetical protein